MEPDVASQPPRPAATRQHWAGTALLLVALAQLAGCAAAGFIAAGVQDARAHAKIDVDAEYRGLDGHTFAVLVTADRMMQAEHPAVVPRLVMGMNDRLKEETLATGYIPPKDLLQYTYNNPRWVARPLGDLAADLGVDRLVLVEIQEYRLYEPGNRYIWDGTVFANVGVIEADALAPHEFVYSKGIRVSFPDEERISPEESNMTARVVATVLESRFINRASWLFYDHEETRSMEY